MPTRSYPYELWSHGIATVVSDPKLVQKQQSNGFGISFEQEPGSHNWFFIPIPTPTVLSDHTNIVLQLVFFSFKQKDNVKIDQYQLWYGGTRIVDDTLLDEFPHNTDHVHTIEVENGKQNVSPDDQGSGVELGLRVNFSGSTSGGRVSIYGAGGYFNYGIRSRS